MLNLIINILINCLKIKLKKYKSFFIISKSFVTTDINYSFITKLSINNKKYIL